MVHFFSRNEDIGSNAKWNTRIGNVEIDLPVLNKFLLCLPLRLGLVIWGYLQLIAMVILSVLAIIGLEGETRYLHGFTLVQAVIMFIIIMIYSLIDIINCGFLILGAQRKNANFLEVTYHYLKVKIPVYAALLIISFMLKLTVYSDNWYWYSLDWYRYTVFLGNQAVGVIDLGLQFYLLLLVRSEIIKLEHPVSLGSLYQRLFSQTKPDDSLTIIPQKEEQKESKLQLNIEDFVPVPVHKNKI